MKSLIDTLYTTTFIKERPFSRITIELRKTLHVYLVFWNHNKAPNIEEIDINFKSNSVKIYSMSSNTISNEDTLLLPLDDNPQNSTK